jgi:pimeloyl-ACP methyl ester carboxylesterase
VLIHALPFDHNLWLYQVERLSAHFRTVAMDLRGWGRSAKPRTPFTLADMGADVLAVLADLALRDDAVVMGCSIGSKIALMLSCDHPELFKAAILVGGNSGPQPQFDHRIAGYRAHQAAGTPKDYHMGHLRYGVTQAWADTPVGRYLIAGFVERGAALDAESIAQVFQALTVSALPGGRRTAALIAHAQHVIIPATGHCCFIENPERFNALVRDFLARNNLWPRA